MTPIFLFLPGGCPDKRKKPDLQNLNKQSGSVYYQAFFKINQWI